MPAKSIGKYPKRRLALYGGSPAVTLRPPNEPGWTPAQVDALHEAIDLGVSDPEYVSSHAGGGGVHVLEERLAAINGGGFAVAVSSGATAIETALRASGIGPGDEVIVPAFGWSQSAAAVHWAGATAVFADIEPTTGNLCPNSAEAAITGHTAALIAAHANGHPADMARLTDLAQRHGIKLIGDCAQALGARYGGYPVGYWGDIACYSFGRNKGICGGEGGLIYTRHRDVFDRAVSESQHLDRQLLHNSPVSRSLNYGFRSLRIHPLSAAAAAADVDGLEKRTRKLSRSNRRLAAGLIGLSSIIPPNEFAPAEHSWYAFAPMWNATGCRTEHNTYLRALQAEGVPVYPCPRERLLPDLPFFITSKSRSIPVPNAADRCARELIVHAGRRWARANSDYLDQLRAAFVKVDTVFGQR